VVWGTKVSKRGPGAEPQWGSGSEAPRSYRYVQCNIVPIKTGFCASSVCVFLLKHALKLKRHIGPLLGYLWIMNPARGGLDLGQMREVFVI